MYRSKIQHHMCFVAFFYRKKLKLLCRHCIIYSIFIICNLRCNNCNITKVKRNISNIEEEHNYEPPQKKRKLGITDIALLEAKSEINAILKKVNFEINDKNLLLLNGYYRIKVMNPKFIPLEIFSIIKNYYFEPTNVIFDLISQGYYSNELERPFISIKELFDYNIINSCWRSIVEIAKCSYIETVDEQQIGSKIDFPKTEIIQYIRDHVYYSKFCDDITKDFNSDYIESKTSFFRITLNKWIYNQLKTEVSSFLQKINNINFKKLKRILKLKYLYQIQCLINLSMTSLYLNGSEVYLLTYIDEKKMKIYEHEVEELIDYCSDDSMSYSTPSRSIYIDDINKIELLHRIDYIDNELHYIPYINIKEIT